MNWVPPPLSLKDRLSARVHAGIPPYENAGGPSILTIPLRITPLTPINIFGFNASAPHHVSGGTGSRTIRARSVARLGSQTAWSCYEMVRPPMSARAGGRRLDSSRASPLTRSNDFRTSWQDEMTLSTRSQRISAVRADSLASKNVRLCRIS